jgi:hypothetical protein
MKLAFPLSDFQPDPYDELWLSLKWDTRHNLERMSTVVRLRSRLVEKFLAPLDLLWITSSHVDFKNRSFLNKKRLPKTDWLFPKAIAQDKWMYYSHFICTQKPNGDPKNHPALSLAFSHSNPDVGSFVHLRVMLDPKADAVSLTQKSMELLSELRFADPALVTCEFRRSMGLSNTQPQSSFSASGTICEKSSNVVVTRALDSGQVGEGLED